MAVYFLLSDADALTLGRYVEESLSAAKVTFSRFGAKLELPEVHLPNIDAVNDVLRMLQHRSNGPSEKTPVGNLLDNLPDSARLPTADDEPKWDGPPVGLVESLRAIAAVEDPHDELLLAAADEIDRWNTEATAVIAGRHYLLGAVARWLAEGLGYPFDIETTIPLHPYMREYVEEAWVVLEGEHGDDLESAIRRNVAQAGGWAS